MWTRQRSIWVILGGLALAQASPASSHAFGRRNAKRVARSSTPTKRGLETRWGKVVDVLKAADSDAGTRHNVGNMIVVLAESVQPNRHLEMDIAMLRSAVDIHGMETDGLQLFRQDIRNPWLLQTKRLEFRRRGVFEVTTKTRVDLDPKNIDLPTARRFTTSTERKIATSGWKSYLKYFQAHESDYPGLTSADVDKLIPWARP
jgi:hypothetical protein